jgi:predicted O-methyltransferase YrrM
VRTARSMEFNERSHNRYWWFSHNRPKYVPPIFDFLSEDEWGLMDAWYNETEKTHAYGTGECNVPAMSFLLGLVMGNNVSRVLQCGHFIGFSTLLLGFMLRRMGHTAGLFSIDVDPDVTKITQRWITEGGLDEYVKLVVSDSAMPNLVVEARQYLRGNPQVMFIDSSHEYRHTLKELRLWVPALQPGGFALLHDVSEFARNFDGSSEGGVKEAVNAYAKENDLPQIMINGFSGNSHFGDKLVYQDACGLGIIQVPS